MLMGGYSGILEQRENYFGRVVKEVRKRSARGKEKIVMTSERYQQRVVMVVVRRVVCG